MTTQPNTEPRKGGEQMPTASDALEALDAMDDYARMDTGVDAIGPREVLRAFIQSHSGHPEPSPAEVGSEGLRSEIEDIVVSLDECKLTVSQAITAIERALNQRLAVKEGEAVGTLHVDTISGRYPATMNVDFTADRDLDLPDGDYRLYTHPVSDDRQAKDAALVEAAKFVLDRFMPCRGDYIFSKRVALDKLAAALSATKQDGHG